MVEKRTSRGPLNKLTPHKLEWINNEIDSFVEKVSPSEAIIDAVYEAYDEIRSIITESGTLKNTLKFKSIEVVIFGSASNGLFDVPADK